MRYFLLALLILAFATAGFCEEMVKVPRSTLDAIKVKLQKLKAIEDGIPYVTIRGIKVIQDVKGKIYLKDTAEVTIKLAMLDYKDDISIKGKVEKYFNPSKEKFISSFGLMTAYDFELKSNTRFENAIYLTYSAFRYNKVALEVVANHLSIGAGISHRLSPNTKLVFAATKKFKDQTTSGLVGVGFQF